MTQRVSQTNEGPTLLATSAIIIYSGHDGGAAKSVAMIHPIRPTSEKDPRPALGTGRPMSSRALDDTVRALYMETKDVLPANLLVFGLTRMVWWVPPRRDIIWFKADANKMKALDKLNGERVNHPGLLMVGQNGRLNVFAVKGNTRPTAATRLYRAPYPNIDDNGAVCSGNFDLPPVIRLSSIATYERAFFDTHFTHTNGRRTRLVRPNVVKFWLNMQAEDADPEPWLMPQGEHTLKSVL